MKYTKRHPLVKEKIHSKPDVQIGKKGITDSLIKEIITLLDKKKVIKLKANKNVAQTKEDFKKLVEELASKIDNMKVIEIRGKTAIIAIHKE